MSDEPQRPEENGAEPRDARQQTPTSGSATGCVVAIAVFGFFVFLVLGVCML